MKVKMVVIFAFLFLAFSFAANAGPDMCTYQTTGQIATQFCDTDGNLLIDVSTGSLTLVSTVTTVDEVASASVRITDGTDIAAVSGAGALSVAGAVTVTGSVTVSATNLDIRDLTAASDTVTIQGGNTVDVSIDDGGNSITVDATNLDIRDLTSASDSVTIQGGNTSDVKVTLDSEAVTVTRLGEFEYDNTNIGAATQTVVSGTEANFVLSVFNGGAGSIFVVMCDDTTCSGETPAAANVGLEIPSGAGKTWENVSVFAISVFNEDTSAAYVSTEWRR